MRAQIAIFGLGNPLMTDEGIGIHVLETIARRDDLPAGVEMIDLGTGGMRLLHQVEGRKKLIFVDCVKMGQQAGTLRRFRPDEVRSKKEHARWSLHDGDLLETLALAEDLGTLPEDVVIFGIEPQRIEPGLELSPALAASLEDYAEQVILEAGENPLVRQRE